MKKRLVRFLVYHDLHWLADRISPSLAAYYMGEKVVKKLGQEAVKTANAMAGFVSALEDMRKATTTDEEATT